MQHAGRGFFGFRSVYYLLLIKYKLNVTCKLNSEIPGDQKLQSHAKYKHDSFQ